MAKLTRRTLLFAAAPPSLLDAVRALPNFCSHEHWGSIESIGTFPGGYRADLEPGALPQRATQLGDLLDEPYLRGWIRNGGGALPQHQATGAYQCTRRGMLALYGVDIQRAAGSRALDQTIAANYGKLFQWYGTAMKKAGFSRLIRIVHPEYYVRPAGAADRVTETILRVDPLLDLWRPETARRKDLVAMAQVDPQDAASWRQFLERIFALAERGGALGTKQLQGYRRSLHYEVRADSDVRRWTGDLTPDEVTVFQDWVMHECSRLAHERGWPHQVHVGTHNLSQSSPLPLESLGRRYPRMKIVMIHCWPFFAEAGWLAKQLPNLYLDTCWLPVLNPNFFRQAMEQWWNYVPLHKITCGHDSTTVEMATGSSLYTREILAELGGEQLRRHSATRTEVLGAIGGFLHGNAELLYGPKRSASR
jgi:hypothetical protein